MPLITRRTPSLPAWPWVDWILPKSNTTSEWPLDPQSQAPPRNTSLTLHTGVFAVFPVFAFACGETIDAAHAFLFVTWEIAFQWMLTRTRAVLATGFKYDGRTAGLNILGLYLFLNHFFSRYRLHPIGSFILSTYICNAPSLHFIFNRCSRLHPEWVTKLRHGMSSTS